MLKLHTLINYFIKFISILASYFTVPILLKIMTQGEYGIWMTILSVVSWVSICDFGFGLGLRNKLIESIALKDYNMAKSYISNSYINLIVITAILIVFSYFILKLLNLGEILNSNINEKTLKITFFITSVFFILNLSLSLIKQIFFAVQLSFLVSLVDSLSQLFFLFSIPLIIFFSNILVGTSIIFGIALVTPLIFSSLIYFVYHKNLSPSIYSYTVKLNKDLNLLSIKFFVGQITAIIVFATGNLILSHYVNSEEVAVYNIVFKIFNGFMVMQSILLMPMWTIYGDSYIKNNISKIKNLFKKTSYIFLILSFCVIIISFFIRYITLIWLQKHIIISNFFIFSMALYTIVYMWNANVNQVICGIGKLNFSTVIAVLGALFNVPVSIYLVKYFHGATGVVLGATFSLLFSSIAMPILVWYYIYSDRRSKILDRLFK